MRRAYDAFIEGLAGVAGLLIAAMCGLIVWDVAARNLGLQPPASTVALTEYGLLYFTMAAAPWLVRRRGHIVVEIFYQRLPAQLAAVGRSRRADPVQCRLYLRRTAGRGADRRSRAAR